MRRWQLTGVALGAAALLFTAGPAQAQVWIGPSGGPPPIAVGRPTPPVWPVPPIGSVPPIGVVPPIGSVPGPVVVSPGWRAPPYWGARRAN